MCHPAAGLFNGVARRQAANCRRGAGLSQSSVATTATQSPGHGGLDKLVYRTDVPVPTPAADEVLIEVSACGMNNTDVWVREGAYGTEAARTPFRPGGARARRSSSRTSRAPTRSGGS